MSGIFSNPEENIKYLNLKEGSVVADFGSGAGHYVIPLAEVVGREGRVYAIDVQKSLLLKTQAEAKSKNIQNIETLWGDLDIPKGSKLRSDTLDAVILSNILFQVENKGTLVQEAKRVLKTGGKVLLIDWTDSFGGLGPQPNHVVDENEAQKIFEENGFVLKERVHAGSHHYGFIFEEK